LFLFCFLSYISLFIFFYLSLYLLLSLSLSSFISIFSLFKPAFFLLFSFLPSLSRVFQQLIIFWFSAGFIFCQL